jgi:RNA polymerase sigma factor (TIGR02999 family)
MREITQLLENARHGDVPARDELFSRVYAELQRLARAKLAQHSAPTQLDAASLVNEACLRLINLPALPGGGRSRFFAYAAGVMRSVIVDCIRERNAQKRGSGVAPVTLVTGIPEIDARPPDIEALDGALEQLAQIDGRAHQIVEMRYFGGLSLEEIADAQGLSVATVKRDWQKARAFLFNALRAQG